MRLQARLKLSSPSFDKSARRIFRSESPLLLSPWCFSQNLQNLPQFLKLSCLRFGAPWDLWRSWWWAKTKSSAGCRAGSAANSDNTSAAWDSKYAVAGRSCWTGARFLTEIRLCWSTTPRSFSSWPWKCVLRFRFWCCFWWNCWRLSRRVWGRCCLSRAGTPNSGMRTGNSPWFSWKWCRSPPIFRPDWLTTVWLRAAVSLIGY